MGPIDLLVPIDMQHAWCVGGSRAKRLCYAIPCVSTTKNKEEGRTGEASKGKETKQFQKTRKRL